MREYLDLLHRVARRGEPRPSRAGPTFSVFGESFSTDCLREGRFPLITTRRVYPYGILGELAAFLTGNTDLKTFEDMGCNYWRYNAEQWAENAGVPDELLQVGRIYGTQWRDWNKKHDQIAALIKSLVNDPYGRRHLLIAWNPSELDQMCLPPCHIFAQFYVSHGYLNCQVYMRSVDLALGLPSDIILYAALLVLVSKATGWLPGTLKFAFGDTHIYIDHMPNVEIQLEREPLELPSYKLLANSNLDNFRPTDFTFKDYKFHERLNYDLF